MAVRLSDIYNPLVFSEGIQEAQEQLSRFINSGVARVDPALSQSSGNIGEIPFYKPLDIVEPNYSNDNPADESTAGKITSAKMQYRLASQNASWSTMDLSRELALQDPVGAITSRIGQYWATINEKRMITSLRGFVSDNIANDGGDMVFDISAATENTADRDSILDALQTAGDYSSNMTMMCAHSELVNELKKRDKDNFTTERDSDTSLMITRYGELQVIVDDSLSAVTDGTTYYDTYFMTKGAIATASPSVTVPSEVERNPSAGNGGGESILHSRRADIIHPYGATFLSTAVAGQSATWAELATASNWDRVYARKQIPLAVLRSVG